MGSTITEADIREIQQVAESGTGKDQEYAKAALAALPKEAAPESGKAEPEKENKVGTEEPETPKETPEVEPEAKPEAKVDQAQEKPDDQRRERVHPAVRRLDREKREMARRLQMLEEQNVTLLKKFDEIQPRKTEKSEADELTALLADPGKYLADRDRRLIETITKKTAEEQKRVAQETARAQVERENALKIINSIEGYVDRRDSDAMLQATAEYLNEVYDTDRYDEEEVAQLWMENPGAMAPVMRKAWLKGRRLDDQTKSDKKAATASPAEAGKRPGGKTPSLVDLNADLAKAMSSGDKEAIADIGKKIERLYREQYGDK